MSFTLDSTPVARLRRGSAIVELPHVLTEPAPALPGSPRLIEGTRLTWTNLRQWLALVLVEGSICRSSTPAHNRCDRLYRSLSIADIRATSDVAALEIAANLFDLTRHREVPGRRGLSRALSREVIGGLLVETRNHLDAIRSGRAGAPRQKGPRFDPTRLPIKALDRLIQTHPNLDVVDRLRIEKRRRLAGASIEDAA